MKEKIKIVIQDSRYLGPELGWKISLTLEHTGNQFGDFAGNFIFYDFRSVPREQAEREAKLEFIEYIGHLARRLETIRKKL